MQCISSERHPIVGAFNLSPGRQCHLSNVSAKVKTAHMLQLSEAM